MCEELNACNKVKEYFLKCEKENLFYLIIIRIYNAKRQVVKWMQNIVN